MKTSRALTLATATLALGFLAARWCSAQTDLPAPRNEPARDYHAGLHELESFVSYLQETKQTNTLARFNQFLSTTLASRSYADLGETLAVLQRLRDGRSIAACDLLEIKLDGDLTSYVASYRELSPAIRVKLGLKLVQDARNYRAKYPFEPRYGNYDASGVADAFKVLDEKPVK